MEILQSCGSGSAFLLRAGSGSALELKAGSGPQNSKQRAVEVWRLKIEPWRANKLVVTDYHQAEEELDSDSDPN
jgi:hypothetical protein